MTQNLLGSAWQRGCLATPMMRRSFSNVPTWSSPMTPQSGESWYWLNCLFPRINLYGATPTLKLVDHRSILKHWSRLWSFSALFLFICYLIHNRLLNRNCKPQWHVYPINAALICNLWGQILDACQITSIWKNARISVTIHTITPVNLRPF